MCMCFFARLLSVLCFDLGNYNFNTNCQHASAKTHTQTHFFVAIGIRELMLLLLLLVHPVSLLFPWASDCLCNLNHLLFVERMPNEWNRCTKKSNTLRSTETMEIYKRYRSLICREEKRTKNKSVSVHCPAFCFLFSHFWQNLNVNL